MHDFISIIFSIFEILSNLRFNNELLIYMVDYSKNIEGYTTNVQVINSVGS